LEILTGLANSVNISRVLTGGIHARLSRFGN
jgi:hypothetical protein